MSTVVVNVVSTAKPVEGEQAGDVRTISRLAFDDIRKRCVANKKKLHFHPDFAPLPEYLWHVDKSGRVEENAEWRVDENYAYKLGGLVNISCGNAITFDLGEVSDCAYVQHDFWSIWKAFGQPS